MRLLRYLLVSGSAVLAAGILTLALTTGTGVTAPPHVSHAAYPGRFISAARASLARYLRHHRPQAMLAPHARAGRNGITGTLSFNWSGYADGASNTPAGTFTAVSGSWTAPSVTCSMEDQITVNWVGLDGMFSGSPEQLGTMAWCYQGSPFYFTWWEMPGGTLTEVGKTLQPGDKISASVTRSGTKYTLKLTDATTTANSFTTRQTCAAATCQDASAEWISERPVFSGVGIPPLAHYSAFKITKGAQTSSGKAGTIGSFSSVSEITMVDATDTYHLNKVSSLNTGQNGFSTTWQNSY